jgi:hypothetical protein
VVPAAAGFGGSGVRLSRDDTRKAMRDKRQADPDNTWSSDVQALFPFI